MAYHIEYRWYGKLNVNCGDWESVIGSQSLLCRKENIMARGMGKCGGTRRKDGSGKGVGQKAKQRRQPKPKRK